MLALGAGLIGPASILVAIAKCSKKRRIVRSAKNVTYKATRLVIPIHFTPHLFTIYIKFLHESSLIYTTAVLMGE